MGANSELGETAMPQIINTNIASINAQRNLDKSQSANQQALQRLSSGLRINSAKDDAAGLSISTRFTSQIKGLNVAVRNAGDGIALAQTAEGALGSINDNLQRIRELAVQSANATNSDVDRDALQAEVSQLVDAISTTASETQFNGRNLLDGSFSATFQVGANAGQTLDVSIAELTAEKLGSSQAAGVSAQGSDSGLQNGDLIINGEAISPSKSEDDTASVDNQAASAISKAAAINSHSDETGVKAFVNENTVSGSEMTGAAMSGTITLNGIEIELTTSTDTATTRASVAQAINAVSDQTGIVATNTESDSLGVTLTAADGRNISLGVDTDAADFNSTLAGVASATGLALGATYDANADTGAFETYEGGFTLVADGDVSEITISGGDGTGNGDLANSGLVAGSYDRGVAQVTSTKITDSVSGDTINETESFMFLEGTATAVALQSTGGNNHSLFDLTGGEVLTISDGQGNTATLGSAGTDVLTTDAAGGFGADKIRDALNAFSGVAATAETVVIMSGGDLNAQSAGTVLSIFDTTTSGAAALASITFAGNTTSDTAQNIAAQINAFTTGIVATVLGTAGNSNVQITDTNGNTLNFSMVGPTSSNLTLDLTVVSRTGATSAAQIVSGSTAANTVGTNVVAVGYVKDIEVDDGKVGEFSITSNKALVGTSLATVASLGSLTTFLATNGGLSSSVTGGAAVINVAAVSDSNVAITQPLTGLGDGDLVLNGVNIKASEAANDTASSTQDSSGNTIKSSLKEASGISVAAAINEVSGETGVSASVNETVVVGGTGGNFDDGSGGGASYVAGDSGKLYINGVDIGTVSLLDDGTGNIDEGRTRQSAIDLINAKSAQTGVTAEDNGESITLRAADGRNVSVAIDNDEANNTGRGDTFGAQIGLDSAVDGIGEADIGVGTTTSNSTGFRGTEVEGDVYETTYSQVTLSSAQAISIEGGTNGADELTALGLTAGSFGGGEDGQFLTDIDISTFEGATEALTAIDNAIGQVASQRADLGATQNRLESTVSNLQVTSENLNAANSRIQDADFAAETAELQRTNVLQQAGISVLAQANAAGQQVLSLLG
jgi:flagellin